MRAFGRAVIVMIACSVATFGSAGLAADPGAPSASVSVRPPLSALPKPPSLTFPPPGAEELHELDEHFSRLTAKDAEERETAVRSVLEVEANLLPAIHRRLTNLAEGADREAMKQTLTRIRDRARDKTREKMREASEKGKVTTPDYLAMVAADGGPDSPGWVALMKVLGMSRMLRQIGTVEAARELVRIYVRFGEFLRVDTQLQLEAMGDRSLAALIEAQRHEAESVARWALRQLDLRGKAIPSETVQTEDHQVLSDVLRAYGRIRDPDAARLVISFANSERAQIRLAARQAVAMMGEVANWQLRDTYESIVGKRAPREWSWDRTARELFTEFDRIRLSQVYRLFEEGLEARRQGDLARMASSFNQVLARSPVFEHRSEMAGGYVDYAKTLLDDDRPRALSALRRAHRLTEEDALRRPVESLIHTLEAEDFLDRGIADQVLLRRAVELDASNTRARSLLERVQRGDVDRESRFNRYVTSGAVGLAAVVAIALILLRRPRRPERSDEHEGGKGEGD